MKNWPEHMLAVLFWLGAIIPFFLVPRDWGLLSRLVLIPVNCLLAFLLWLGVIRIFCKRYDSPDYESIESKATPDNHP
jgi:hypothetical protein